MNNRREYTAEFKREAVRLSNETAGTIAAVAHDLGIAPKMLYRWRAEARALEDQAFPGHGNGPDSELRELQKKLTGAAGTRHPKKSVGHFLSDPMSTYRFIEMHRDTFPVNAMCRVLGVSRSGYYAWRQRPLSHRERENRELLAAIKVVYAESGKTYGSPRIHQALQKQGWTCGRHRVSRLMREHHIQGISHKRKVRTTWASKAAESAKDLVGRDFTARRPNEKWVADITYVSTAEGWLYVAAVLDLYSRKIVGWSMAPHMKASLVCEALEMAIRHRQPPVGLIHHSDRGSQDSHFPIYRDFL